MKMRRNKCSVLFFLLKRLLFYFIFVLFHENKHAMIHVRPPPSSGDPTFTDDVPRKEEEDMLVWYGAKFLASIHGHSRDSKIRYVDHRRFYVKWQDIRDKDVTFEDTVSVTTLVPSSSPLTEDGGDDDRDASRRKGLLLHRALECYYNGFVSALDVLGPSLLPIVSQYLLETETTSHIVPWRTEMAVFSDMTTLIVGVLDAVFVDKEKSTPEELVVHLRDWKYSSQSPLLTHQLNLYTYLLEEFYQDIHFEGKTHLRMRVETMALVYFHETYGHRVVHVPRQPEDLDHILAQRRRLVREKSDEEEIPL